MYWHHCISRHFSVVNLDINKYNCIFTQIPYTYTLMSSAKCYPFCLSLNALTLVMLILGLHPANERRHYKVTPSLIGWVQTYYQPWRQHISLSHSMTVPSFHNIVLDVDGLEPSSGNSSASTLSISNFSVKKANPGTKQIKDIQTNTMRITKKRNT